MTDDSDIPQFVRHPNGDVQMHFSSEHMKRWIQDGIIPPELAEAFKEGQERINHQRNQIQEFKQKYPNGSIKEYAAFLGLPKTLTEEESEKMRREIQQSVDLHNYMVQNWELLVSVVSKKGKKTLFKGILQPHEFGVPRLESDPLYRWRDLLDAMEVKHREDNDYYARSEIKNSKGCAVVLEYDFKAANWEQAEKILAEYKTMMNGKGLRAFFAYWYSANEHGGLSFNCSISGVMDQISSEERGQYQKTANRTEFWAITRTLAATKFKLEWPGKKNPGRPRKGKKGPKVEWIEQPLLQIHGGKREIGEECPISIKVTVLTKESAEVRFMPATYSVETLHLHPSDVLFATVIQARADQRKGKEISMNWDFAFRIANVEGKAKANRSAAKTKVRTKLDKFRDKKIIQEWRSDREGVSITPKKKGEQTRDRS